MNNPEVRKAKETIAAYLGFEKSEAVEHYWTTPKWGFTLLHFDTSWEWLIYAIIEIQKKYKYQLKDIPYDLENECLKLAEFIEHITSKKGL